MKVGSSELCIFKVVIHYITNFSLMSQKRESIMLSFSNLLINLNVDFFIFKRMEENILKRKNKKSDFIESEDKVFKMQKNIDKKKLLILSGISLFTILGGTLAYFTTSTTLIDVFNTGKYEHNMSKNLLVRIIGNQVILLMKVLR